MAKARVDRFGDNGEIAELVLDGPPLNLFDNAMIADVATAVGTLTDPAIRAVLFRAEGRHFCAGVDVHEFQGRTNAEGAALMQSYLDVVHALEALPVPTVAVTQGLCLTIGLELSLGCDLLWAAEDGKFGMVEATVGLTPGAGGTQRLAARAGAARAAEIVLTGQIYEATVFESWGVVNRLVPADSLLDEARAFVQKLAAGPTVGFGAGKQILRAQREGGIAAADAVTAHQSGLVFETSDIAAGIAAVLAKKPGTATFSGR